MNNRLENDDLRLFQRTTRRVVITEDGERVYTHAQTILENLDDLFDEVFDRLVDIVEKGFDLA